VRKAWGEVENKEKKMIKMVKIFKIQKMNENCRRFTSKKKYEKMGGCGLVELWKVLETKESEQNLRLGARGREKEAKC
jgi:hypothetical protein